MPGRRVPTSEGASPPGVLAGRDRSIDVAKGIAIIAVVAGHVLRGFAAADILAPTHTYVTADIWLYSWHLPVFALTSGLFVARSVRGSGSRRYLTRRLLLFGYLYLLWSMLQGSVKLMAAGNINTPTTWVDLVSLWRPDGQLWFLPWIAAMSLVGTVLVNLPARWRLWVAAPVVTSVSLASWGWQGSIAGTQGWGLLVFYATGATLGAVRYQQALRGTSRSWAALAGAIALGAAVAVVAILPVTPPTDYGQGRTPGSVAMGVAVSVVCTGAILLLSHPLARIPGLGRFLAHCGKLSLAIFLAHIIATAGTRTVLLAVGIDHPGLLVGSGILIGVLGPLFLWHTGVALGFPWLFDMPMSTRSRTLPTDRA